MPDVISEFITANPPSKKELNRDERLNWLVGIIPKEREPLIDAKIAKKHLTNTSE